MPRRLTTPTTLFLLPLLLVSLSGCRLLRIGGDKSTRAGDLLDAVGLKVRPVGMATDAMQLEFVFAHRPRSDPLLGEALWERIDTIGRRPAEIRAALLRHGLRVGQVGAAPPPPLEELLSLTAPSAADPAADGRDGPGDDRSDAADRRQLRGWRVFLRDGGETEVVLSKQPLEHVSIVLYDGNTARLREFADARFVLRITARRLRDGWARLECLPEVHHGLQRLRYTASEEGWKFRTQQNIVPLYGLSFTVDLTVGEMAVVTAAGPGDGGEPLGEAAVGRGCFLDADGRQRVLVIRLANMPRSRELYTRLTRSSRRDEPGPISNDHRRVP